VSYLTTPREADLPLKACLEATEDDLLIVEAHYVIEGALLERLVVAGTTAFLGDERTGSTLLEEGYAGAAFLTRPDLERLSADVDALPWPTGLMQLPTVKVMDVRQSDLGGTWSPSGAQ